MMLTMDAIRVMNEMLERLGHLDRWTGLTNVHNVDEANKQAANCLAAYLLAKEAESKGNSIQWSRFPKIAINRSFQKVLMNFDIPETTLQEICEIAMIHPDVFDKETKRMIAEKINQEFANFICDGVGTYEAQIYRAATKIVTLAELYENERKMEDEFLKKIQELTSSLMGYYSIPGVKDFSHPESEVFKLIRKIIKLRYMDRWQTRIRNQGAPVLRHLLDTAVCAYFMHLEICPDDETTATRLFFLGIFHDVPETWTKDIPSPVKDRIPGFRDATEKYELKQVEDNLYNPLPKHLADAVKEVMMEDPANSQYKAVLKGADYMAADMECYRLFRAGSKDDYYEDVFARRLEDLQLGKSYITPLFRRLFDEFYDEVKRETFSKDFYEVCKKYGNGEAKQGLERFIEVMETLMKQSQ